MKNIKKLIPDVDIIIIVNITTVFTKGDICNIYFFYVFSNFHFHFLISFFLQTPVDECSDRLILLGKFIYFYKKK